MFSDFRPPEPQGTSTLQSRSRAGRDSTNSNDSLRRQVTSRRQRTKSRGYNPAGTATGRGIAVDLVPFGGVERPQFTIAWSPDAETHLHVFTCSDMPMSFRALSKLPWTMTFTLGLHHCQDRHF
jgi:hypothetical protein